MHIPEERMRMNLVRCGISNAGVCNEPGIRINIHFGGIEMTALTS